MLPNRRAAIGDQGDAVLKIALPTPWDPSRAGLRDSEPKEVADRRDTER
jgi:hypothetical protein